MPGSVVRDVSLRDGTTVRLRSPGPADESELTAFLTGWMRSRCYLRFHGLGGRMEVSLGSVR